ncbi:MAG: hypothetical protein ACE5JN_01860 [Candidatus Methylomirabilia bacterium]
MKKVVAMVLLNWFLFYWSGHTSGWVVFNSYLNKSDCFKAARNFQAKHFAARCVEIKFN